MNRREVVTMVSDHDIAKGVESLLRHSDPNSVTTVNGVVQQLEAKLGLDLSHKAGFIRDQIDLLLRSHPPSFLLPPHHPQHSRDHYTPHLQQHFPTTLFPSHFALHPHTPSSHHEINFQQPLPNNAHAFPQNAPPPELPKQSVPTGGKRKGGAGGLNKVCGVSPELQAVVGESALPRTEIVRQLWAYIRKHNLQDPGNKRKIICDDALRSLFETDCTDMFKMNKLLSKHIIPLGPSKESQAKRAKVEAESTFQMAERVNVETESTFKMTEQVKAEAESTFQMPERVKVEAESAFQKTELVKLEAERSFQMNERVKLEAESTFQAAQPASSTVIISEALAKFLGTGRREMQQSEVMRLVWEYIKLNHLEDPLNAMMISCDAKLQELLGCESISALGISEMLQRHHIFKQSDSSSC